MKPKTKTRCSYQYWAKQKSTVSHIIKKLDAARDGGVSQSICSCFWQRQLMAFAKQLASLCSLTRREETAERVVRLVHVADQLDSNLFSSGLEVRKMWRVVLKPGHYFDSPLLNPVHGGPLFLTAAKQQHTPIFWTWSDQCAADIHQVFNWDSISRRRWLGRVVSETHFELNRLLAIEKHTVCFSTFLTLHRRVVFNIRESDGVRQPDIISIRYSKCILKQDWSAGRM